MVSTWCREDGMALAEVLVAIGVLTVGLLGSAQLVVITMQTHVLARETTDATRPAQAKVEELVKSDFATDPACKSPARRRTHWRITRRTTTTCPA